MYMRSSDGKPDWEHAQIQMAIVRYMEQEYSQPTTLQKAADYFGYEPCYFSKLFVRHRNDPGSLGPLFYRPWPVEPWGYLRP